MTHVCPCGSEQQIWVTSHSQCAACGRVLESCCEGICAQPERRQERYGEKR